MVSYRAKPFAKWTAGEIEAILRAPGKQTARYLSRLDSLPLGEETIGLICHYPECERVRRNVVQYHAADIRAVESKQEVYDPIPR